MLTQREYHSEYQEYWIDDADADTDDDKEEVINGWGYFVDPSKKTNFNTNLNPNIIEERIGSDTYLSYESDYESEYESEYEYESNYSYLLLYFIYKIINWIKYFMGTPPHRRQ